MTEITLRKVCKSFGAVQVIHDVDLTVGSGEFVVFVGPSGCGKSTLLRLIAGLEKVTSGEVEIEGVVVNEVGASDRGLAMVFQSYALYPHMTVYGNMAFGLENSHMPKAEIRDRVQTAAEMLQITDYLDRKPKALSGGQRQRVAIGRAIVRDPKAFLFDEPLSNLDAELRVTMRKELAALHAKIGGTMIYVTHDQIEAMTLANKIVVLQGGRVEQVGAPLDLYNTPVNAFVAGFIGSPRMNLIDAVAEVGPDGTFLLSGETRIAIPTQAGLADGARCSYGVRPEHIGIAETGAPDVTGDGVLCRASRRRDLSLLRCPRPATDHAAPERAVADRPGAAAPAGVRPFADASVRRGWSKDLQRGRAMSDKLGLAVIGCGMASKPHALALKALSDEIAVRGVYGRDPGKRDRFCAEYGFPAAASAEALAKDESVDAVLLLTPPNARGEFVDLFAAAGKHVLSEKPLERTVAAAERIVQTCRDRGVTLGVVFQHRFRAASEDLARRLAAGELGAIRMVRVEVPWWRDQAYYDEPGRGSYARDGGGVLISQAIHTLDLMLSLTGPVSAVQAMVATTALHRMDSEDFAAGALQFANGAVGALFATTAAYPGDAESIRLECDAASVLLQSGTVTYAWRDGRIETAGTEATTGGGADPMAFPFDWHRDLIADFVAAIRDDRAPRVSGEDGLRVQRLIAAIERSSSQYCRVNSGGMTCNR